ncbi:MAG TPA: hypothetical protein VKY53_05410 [Marinobacter sp.]|nr:hypothetical protein [Marinobacter sp.]
MMFKPMIFSATVAVALASAPALAEGMRDNQSSTPQTTGQQYGTGDAGGQASASFQNTQGATFEELDQDGNGQLDMRELNRYGATAAGNTNSADLINEYDNDGDDTLNKEEFKELTGSGRDHQDN